ncbi:MAG: hypothetical protein MO846_08625 [Candidatus Devosia symbiotica]|nr:hypothetical protein [Candidatus Devosia symbiotica]
MELSERVTLEDLAVLLWDAEPLRSGVPTMQAAFLALAERTANDVPSIG